MLRTWKRKPVRRILLAALLVLAGGTIAHPAAAGGCYAYGCQIGPCIAVDLIVDRGFENDCPAWVFGSWAARRDHDLCGWGTTKTAELTGRWVETEFGYLYQDLDIPTYADGGATLGFYLEITGTASSWNRLTITIRNTSNQVLEEVASIAADQTAASCQFLQYDVSEYRGQTIRLHFEAITGKGTVFYLDEVYFWQSV